MGKVKPYTEWLNELIDNINDAYEETRVEYYEFLEDKLEKNYERIIDTFYSSYDPVLYKRKGKGEGGLKDLLVIEKDDSGMDIGFKPSNLLGREGYNGDDGLYKTVFLQGFHGGAYIPDAQQFLVPWTYPHVEYNGISSPWGNPKPWEERVNMFHGWHPAERTVAPYRLWKSFIDGYNRGQYQKDFDVIFNKNVKKYF